MYDDDGNLWDEDPPPLEVEVKYLPNPLLLKQDQTAFGLGGRLWPGSEVLIRHIADNQELLAHCHSIVELGSGTGAVGIAISALLSLTAGSQDHRVVVTDLENLVPLLEANIGLNGTSQHVRAAPLFWGTGAATELASELGGFADAVVMADVAYTPSAHGALADTLETLSCSKTLVLHTHLPRHPPGTGEAFCEELGRRGWTTEELPSIDRVKVWRHWPPQS
mmetsp:Transcript_40329/g.111065  ORF Transcript_40329/g.111065 Transcript_40329/m.111065 type:complete len:222 (+) Transcript_40329:60-725(+)